MIDKLKFYIFSYDHTLSTMLSIKIFFVFFCFLQCRSLTTNIVEKTSRFPKVHTKLRIDWKKKHGTILIYLTPKYLHTWFLISYPSKQVHFFLLRIVFLITAILLIIHLVCLCHLIGGFKSIIGQQLSRRETVPVNIQFFINLFVKML